jgi:hypothetical protein
MKHCTKYAAAAVLGILLLGCAKVTGVVLTAPSLAARGGTAQFTAVVEGTGNPRQTVTWEIAEAAAEGTSISPEGLLTVAEEEPLLRFTVRAVSAADKKQSAEVPVLLADALYGAWRVRRSGGTMTLTISAESLTGRYNNGNNYTIEDLSWTAVENDDPATRDEYPLGYLAGGRATRVYRVSRLSLGEQRSFRFYPNVEGTKLLRVMEGEADYVFDRVEE